MKNLQEMVEFAERTSVEQVEESADLAPKFDASGVIPCVTMHHGTREVLMFAFMNEEALKLTITTGLAHYWSRSRKKLWKKGESSGMFQKIERMLIDDDQDCIVIEVSLTEEAPRRPVTAVTAVASIGKCQLVRVGPSASYNSLKMKKRSIPQQFTVIPRTQHNSESPILTNSSAP